VLYFLYQTSCEVKTSLPDALHVYRESTLAAITPHRNWWLYLLGTPPVQTSQSKFIKICSLRIYHWLIFTLFGPSPSRTLGLPFLDTRLYELANQYLPGLSLGYSIDLSPSLLYRTSFLIQVSTAKDVGDDLLAYEQTNRRSS
jgi:hypothetical protein